MGPHAPITDTVFAASLRCETKAFLLLDGTVPTDPEIQNWQQRIANSYKVSALKRHCTSVPKNETCVGMPSLRVFRERHYGLILDPEISSPEVQIQAHALERIPASRSGPDTVYRPVRFLPNEKLVPLDKLLVALDALALSRLTGRMPPTARIVHGSGHRSTVVQLPKLVKQVRSLVNTVRSQYASGTPPSLALNKHCPECAFRSRCRQIAIEKDDLSLLTTLSEKERKKLIRKGITTVAQFSCTYRPRRRSARNRATTIKHEPALKALAIQANRIHVVDAPIFGMPSGGVYLDVEGVPDREFYYLAGMRYLRDDTDVHLAFWADDPSGEREMWVSLLHALAQIPDVRLVHYGSYETQFLKRMKERYCESSEDNELVDRLIATSTNLLSLTYAHIYFPTYSNGLKEIANYLGFHWSEAHASGVQALMWRSEWEASREPKLKQKLLTYNSEDCAAAQRVAEAIYGICSEQTIAASQSNSTNVSLMQDDHLRKFGKLSYALPEFKSINEAAYWNYQRTKVYARSNKRLSRASRTQPQRGKANAIIDKTIQVEAARPERCPRCNSKRLYINGHYGSTVQDLHFSRTGVKRWTVRYKFLRYQCWTCKRGYNELPRQESFGKSLKAYALYQMIELHVPQHAVARNLNTLFGFQFSAKTINAIKASSATQYQETYERILQRIVAGKLVHADETQAIVKGASQYVWVFTSLEEVAYIYSDTREAHTLQRVLHDFDGVLVSDFYTAYDSIDCLHQKCLIHRLRDINEDVFKHPFNDEMVEVAHAFAALIRPIVETIDQFGLKARHLRKHKTAVERFYRVLAKRNYHTEVAGSYKKRFEKNRGKLFTFLDYDHVPWNNNNAEHAIKAFVRLRNVIGGMSTPKGMRDYLVLLSICETCKYKGIGFLDFLRSAEMDVDTFAAHTGRARRTTRTPNAKARGGGDQEAAHSVSNGLI
ncbi:IS66 family transposase [Microvirga yunnanensis]|uniref:IS66 family transposase n=1 Tax=Microvirga yunnanensis TaxID=2953740 RepID=UPI0021C8DB08|nr:IS66 family transposase [Microvirga sp. HBU65207]